jgi:hypothetical protein
MQQYKSLNSLILTIFLSFFSSFNFPAFSSPNERDERLQFIFAGWHTVDKPLHSKGLTLLVRVVTDKDRFELGRKFQKGEISDFKEVTPERLLMEMACYAGISDTTENLNLRALHNLGVTNSKLADCMLAKGISSTDKRITIFYQNAWYYFSLAGLNQSISSMTALVNNKKINSIVGNRSVEEKSTMQPTIEMFTKRFERDMGAFLKTQLPTLDKDKASVLQINPLLNGMVESFKKSFEPAVHERLKSIN